MPSPLENSKTLDLFFLVISSEVVFVGIPFVLFFLQNIILKKINKCNLNEIFNFFKKISFKAVREY
jgi:hypothetical protein